MLLKKNLLHLQIVKKLNYFIAEYEKVLLYQTNAPVDPRSYPENFNGTWMPWIQLSLNEIPILY